MKLRSGRNTDRSTSKTKNKLISKKSPKANRTIKRNKNQIKEVIEQFVNTRERHRAKKSMSDDHPSSSSINPSLPRIDEEAEINLDNVFIGPENNPENLSEEEEETPRTRKMSEFVRRPDILDTKNGNLSENWRRFKRGFDIYMRATELENKADTVKISVFLNVIGDDAVDVYDTFQLTDAQRADYAQVTKAFNDFCEPKKNTVYERFMFYQRRQKDGEPFDTFLMDIKRLIKNCEFGDQENTMLRDQIVMGITDKNLQRKLLGEANLSYDSAVDKSKANEATKQQAERMSNTAIDVITSNNKQHTQTKAHGKNQNSGIQQRENGSSHQQQQRQFSEANVQHNQRQNNGNRFQGINCKYCGNTHGKRECPAYGKICTSCSKKNHFARVCRFKKLEEITTNDDNFDDDYDFSDNEEFCITTLENVTSTDETDDALKYPWMETVKVNEHEIEFKVDSGAQTDVLPVKEFRRLKGIELRTTNITLRAFGGQTIRPIGMCSLLCNFNGTTLRRKFAVVDLDITPILGLITCIRFGMFTPSNKKCKTKRNTSQM